MEKPWSCLQIPPDLSIYSLLRVVKIQMFGSSQPEWKANYIGIGIGVVCISGIQIDHWNRNKRREIGLVSDLFFVGIQSGIPSRKQVGG